MALGLPNELLLDISQRLPISDCNSLRLTCTDNRLQECYTERISIQKHLSRHLLDGEELLEAMAKSGTALLGAMALEYFLPGCAKEGAAWVFVVSPDRRKREYFVKFMESKGTSWNTALDTLRSHLSEKSKGRLIDRQFAMKRQQFCRAAIASNHENLVYLGQEFLASDAPIVTAYEAFGLWEYTASYERLEDYEIWGVLHGRIPINEKTKRVRLIYGHQSNNLGAYLSALPSTAYQCFINGFGAVHMYGKLTEERLRYIWKANYIDASSRAGQWIRDIDIETFGIAHSSKNRLNDPIPLNGCGIPNRDVERSHARDSFDSESVVIKAENSFEWPNAYHETSFLTSCQLRWLEEQQTFRLRKTATDCPLYGPSPENLRSFCNSLLPHEVDEEYLAEYGL